MRLPATSFLHAQRHLRSGALTTATTAISKAAAQCHAVTLNNSVAIAVSSQRAAFATSSSFSSTAHAPTSQALLQDAARRGKRRPGSNSAHRAVAGTGTARGSREEQLAALGLEHDQSNAYYNQHLRAALDRKDLRTAAQLVSALSVPSTSDRSALPSSLEEDARKPVIWTRNYDSLLFEWSQRGDVNQALALLDEMVALDRVSTRSFNTALVACSKKRKLKQAARVLQQMREAGKTPGPFAFANVINCCSKGDGNVHAATKLWDEMLNDGVEPSIEVVNCMLRVFSRANGRSQDALAFFRDAIQAFDLAPDAISISTLVQALLQDAETDDVVDFLEELQSGRQNQLKVELSVLNAVLDACRQLGGWENAVRVQDLILSQHQSSSDRNADTKRLIALCEAQDASAPSVAWALAARNTPISARDQQKELLKKEKQSPAHLRKVLQEILSTLEEKNESSSLSSVLRRVENMKQWERVFVANPIDDVEKFFRMCQQLENAAANRKTSETALLGVRMYNHFLFALARHSDKLETALQTLDKMIERQIVDETSFNNVLAMCSRFGRLKVAEQVLEKMKLLEYKPSTFSYNALLNCCALKRDVTKAETSYEELKTQGLSPDVVTINTLLKTYASMTKRASQRHKAHLLGENEKKSESNYAQRALQLFQRSSRKLKIEPTAATYFSLFRTFVQEADRVAAFDEEHDEEDDDDYDDGLHDQIAPLIKRICTEAPVERLDGAVFNASIDYFQRLGDVKTCFDLFNTMKVRGFEPNDTTLSLLFAACAREEQVDTGLKFLHYLMDEQHFQPTIDVLNGAIQLCASSGSPQNALELFNGIQSSGGLLQANEATFEHLIHAFGRQGDVTLALEYTHAMKEQLGVASTNAYNRVLQACATASAPLEALEILQHMRENEGLVQNAVSYNMVLKAFAKVTHKRSQEEDGDSDEEEEDGYEDDEETGDIFGAEDHDGNEDRAFDIVEEADGDENKREYAAVDAEARRVEAEKVRNLISELLEDMHNNGVPPSSITYTRAIAACAIRGDTYGVLLFFDELLHSGSGSSEVARLLSESSLQNYLKACSRTRDLDRVTDVMKLLTEWHNTSGNAISPRVILQVLNTLEDLGQWRRAVVVLRDLETTYGVRPNVVFFNRVMEMCNTAGEFSFVDQIFTTMRDAAAYRIFPTSQSYIEAIFAAEQREEWVQATNLFMEMQNKCAKDDISTAQLQKIALGRYSEGRHKL
ncbi:Ppr repeat protein [Globisporangium polare]